MFQLELFWHWNCELIINWIASNRTVYMYKIDLALINYNGWYAIKPNQTKTNQSLIHIWSPNKVELGVMTIKGYSEFPKAPVLLEPHHQFVKCHIQDTRWGVLPHCREAVCVIYSPSRQSEWIKGKYPTIYYTWNHLTV